MKKEGEQDKHRAQGKYGEREKHRRRGKRELVRMLAGGLFFAAVFCLVARLGLLYQADNVVSDAFYQRESAGETEMVCIIGIDDRTMEELGPMPWPRSVMAEAIRKLNVPDNSLRPSVIGIDVLYAGERDLEDDLSLASAAEEGGNVVTAGAAIFGSAMAEENGQVYLDNGAVVDWEMPYSELAAVTETGHINTMEDEDAILRHALLYVDVPGYGRVDSFSYTIYRKYCESSASGLIPVPPKTKDRFFYIPFTKKRGGYADGNGYSLAALLDGELDPETFAGKIVLIGPYAIAMQDNYRTSIDHAAPMYGVEVHANLIDAYAAGFYPGEAQALPQYILLFLLSLLMFLFLYDRRIIAAVVLWLSASFLWLGLCEFLYSSYGIVLHVLWIPLAFAVLFVASVSMNYVRSQRERRRVTSTFGRYVDPAVMRRLLDRGSESLELGGKMYDIAVLFVDVRGFTSMSEALDPHTVVEIINRYLTLTTECIMRNHGTLDKFVGDCTMAFWNAPFPQDDPVYLACRAAMDMVKGSEALGEELLQRFGRTVSFGIGVNYGPAVVGNIGAPLRMDYTAIGDTVNTSARLEANAPGGKILISRAVADALGDRAEVTSLGSTIKLKGKAEGFEILTLDSLKDPETA